MVMLVIKICSDHVRCVPSQSTATIKLELLPLTDGIITLDTLQIDVKEKGEHPPVYLFMLIHILTKIKGRLDID